MTDTGAPVGPGSHEPDPQAVPALTGFDPSRDDDPIVGHKTWADGSHTLLRQSEAEGMWQSAVAAKDKRAADMPTEQDAIEALWSAYQRLKELDWNDPIYCPKDGSLFDVIEAGSTGIHKASYQGEWPSGHWWIHEDGDLSPSRPVLYRRTEAEKAKWAQLRERFARDSDGSPEGGDACGSVHDGADPKGIAKTEVDHD